MSDPATVLIVDDDPQMLRLVQTMLGARNVHVLLAPRPSAALQICGERTVHLLITDISMPEMDGVKLAERVLKLQPNANVLLISGNYNEMPKGVRAGQIRFLKKPFFPSDLVEQVRAMLPAE